MIKKRFGRVGGLSTMTFSERVIQIALSIPRGKVTTYGEIARAAGAGPMAAQSITSILGKAYARGITTIPFHRIVYAKGRIWITDEYRKERMKQYAAEGLHITPRGYIEDFEKKRYDIKYAKKKYKCIGKLWIYPSEKAAWYFLTIPKKDSLHIKDTYNAFKRGWGSLPVTITINHTTWNTSLFPDSKTGTYIVPIKANVRRSESLQEHDTITYTFSINT